MQHLKLIEYFQGDYLNHECGLNVSEARAEDAGEWTCEFESYVKNGKRGDGVMARVSHLNVI